MVARLWLEPFRWEYVGLWRVRLLNIPAERCGFSHHAIIDRTGEKIMTMRFIDWSPVTGDKVGRGVGALGKEDK